MHRTHTFMHTYKHNLHNLFNKNSIESDLLFFFFRLAESENRCPAIFVPSTFDLIIIIIIQRFYRSYYYIAFCFGLSHILFKFSNEKHIY